MEFLSNLTLFHWLAIYLAWVGVGSFLVFFLKVDSVYEALGVYRAAGYVRLAVFTAVLCVLLWPAASLIAELAGRWILKERGISIRKQ